jgi:cytochrome c oxidase subunit 3
VSSEAIPHTVEPHPVTGLPNGKFGIWLFLASEVMLFGALFSTYILLRVGAKWWPHGADMLNVPLATINTLVLITSSVTMVMAWASLKMKNLGGFKKYLGATIALAFVFLVIKYFEYNAKFTHTEVWLKDGRSVSGHVHERDDDKIVLAPDAVQHTAYAAQVAAAGGKPVAWGEKMEIEMSDVVRVSSFGPAHSTFTAIYFTLTGLHGLHIVGGILVNLFLLLFGVKMWKTEPERFTNRIENAGLYWHFVDLVWIFLFPVLYLL